MEPEDRRPVSAWSCPHGEMHTLTLDRAQLWRQYGWMDHLGRLYDLSENPADYGVASFSPLWVLVDDDRVEPPDASD